LGDRPVQGLVTEFQAVPGGLGVGSQGEGILKGLAGHRVVVDLDSALSQADPGIEVSGILAETGSVIEEGFLWTAIEAFAVGQCQVHVILSHSGMDGSGSIFPGCIESPFEHLSGRSEVVGMHVDDGRQEDGQRIGASLLDSLFTLVEGLLQSILGEIELGEPSMCLGPKVRAEGRLMGGGFILDRLPQGFDGFGDPAEGLEGHAEVVADEWVEGTFLGIELQEAQIPFLPFLAAMPRLGVSIVEDDEGIAIENGFSGAPEGGENLFMDPAIEADGRVAAEEPDEAVALEVEEGVAGENVSDEDIDSGGGGLSDGFAEDILAFGREIFIGIEHENPVPSGLLQPSVARLGKMVYPSEFDNSGPERPGDVHRPIG
jgi:hypothetical protein